VHNTSDDYLVKKLQKISKTTKMVNFGLFESEKVTVCNQKL